MASQHRREFLLGESCFISWNHAGKHWGFLGTPEPLGNWSSRKPRNQELIVLSFSELETMCENWSIPGTRNQENQEAGTDSLLHNVIIWNTNKNYDTEWWACDQGQAGPLGIEELLPWWCGRRGQVTVTAVLGCMQPMDRRLDTPGLARSVGLFVPPVLFIH